MDPGQIEDPSEPKGTKREIRAFPSSFKVTRVSKKQKILLEMVKPDLQSGVACITYPTVSLKEQSVEDKHAFRIMHDLNHRNILSMKTFCQSKDIASSVVAFVEPYEGFLWELCDPEQCFMRSNSASTHHTITDKINHVPSEKLQSYLRQIVLGIDFLRKNGLYHGDLTWESTLYNENTVKLAGFRSKKESMSEDDAYWNDWTCFLKMLEILSYKVKVVNQSSPEDCQCFCGNLDSLINMLKKLDRTSLSTIAQTILEHIFFWNSSRRIKYFAHKISLKLTDGSLTDMKFSILGRGKSWYTDSSADFKMIVSKMNKFRKDQIKKQHEDQNGKACEDEKADKNENVGAYNGGSLKDYVRVICGAYTHRRQMQLDADGIIRKNHPTICIDVKNIIEAPDSEDSSAHASQCPCPVQDCSKYTTQSDGYGQGHGAAFLSGLTSQSQHGYGYPSRGMPPPQNSGDQQLGPHPPRGGMGRNQRQGAGSDQQQGPCPPRGGMGQNQRQGAGSDSFRQTFRPFNSQPPRSNPPGPGNYSSYGHHFEAPGYGQPQYPHDWPQQNYDHGYGPMYIAPSPHYYYAQPPMGPQQSFYPAPSPYYQHGQANVNYPPAYYNHGSAYLHSGHPTARTAGQAGNSSSAQAAGQSAHAQGGYIHPPANPGGSSAPADGQRGIHPPANPPSSTSSERMY